MVSKKLRAKKQSGYSSFGEQLAKNKSVVYHAANYCLGPAVGRRPVFILVSSHRADSRPSNLFLHLAAIVVFAAQRSGSGHFIAPGH
jgi:hypothetical protein